VGSLLPTSVPLQRRSGWASSIGGDARLV